MTEFLDLDDLVAAAEAAVGRPAEVRDWGLLEAALARPQASVFGSDAYPTLPEKAAALIQSLARNHALIDGNKRLAWIATRLFFILNDQDFRAPSVDEGETFVLAIATGELDLPKIAETIAGWARPL